MAEVVHMVISSHLPSEPLVRASGVLALSLAAASHRFIQILIHLSAAVVEVQRERIVWQMWYRILVMNNTVRARSF